MERLQFKKNNIIYDSILTYHDDDTKKDYILYTDNIIKNNVNIYYSLYKKDKDNIVLFDVKEREDKEICLELIKEYLSSIKK